MGMGSSDGLDGGLLGGESGGCDAHEPEAVVVEGMACDDDGVDDERGLTLRDSSA